MGFAKALCTASPSAQQHQVTFMSTNHMPDTLIYLSDILLVNPNSLLPWTLGAWDLALLGTGSFSGLVPSQFDSMKRNL